MRAILLSLVVLTVTLPAAAQSGGFVPYIGYNIEDEDFLIGLGFRFGVPTRSAVAVSVQPTAEYQFVDVDDVTVAQFDVNLLAELRSRGAVAPYLGAGVGILYVSVPGDSETEFGLNVLGGLAFNPTGFGRPFVEGRFSTRGDVPDAITVKGGVVLAF